jgi:hypothetical protein
MRSLHAGGQFDVPRRPPLTGHGLQSMTIPTIDRDETTTTSG